MTDTDDECHSDIDESLLPLATDEEVAARVTEAKRMVNVFIENYSFETHRANTEVDGSCSSLVFMWSKFDDVTHGKAAECQLEIGSYIVEAGLVPILCEMVVDYMTTGWLDVDGEEDQDVYYKFSDALLILFNYSDTDAPFGQVASEIPGFFEFLEQKLRRYYDIHMGEEEMIDSEMDLGRRLLGFIHNISVESTARARLREVGFTNVLLLYLKSPIEHLKMTSILSLANIVDEEEGDLIATSVEAVRFILRALGEALEDPTGRVMGWTTQELAIGVGRLATNDSNKKILVNEGALPLLLQLSKIECSPEHKVAVEALWTLSFDNVNKKKMLAEPGLMPQLVQLSKCCNGEIRNRAQGVLWTLLELGNSLFGEQTNQTKVGDDNATHRQHVMISYQWDNQKLLTSLADALRSTGFKIWMDIDNMSGSTLQAMAEAVENSVVILMCMSKRYKESPNCRAEAEYAFNRRVPIVPLLMETGFKPDGILGIIQGTKLYFDFSGKYSFENKMSALVSELGDRGRAGHILQIPRHVTPVSMTPKDNADAPHSKDTIKGWKKYNVEKWLLDNKLNSPALQTVTGIELIFLGDLKAEDPRTFYKLLMKRLGLESVRELATFVQALAELY